MSFIETVQRAGELLRQQGRISLRALKLEFNLDDEQIEAMVDELVDIQRVAVREGKALSWIGRTGQADETATDVDPASAPQTSAEAERRQLTVLFCDLVDSTRLAAGMDAEDWREVVRDYQATAARVAERFEGHIAQYLGDGLLVYFGWPRAHEDDAERAVRAGLGIVAAIAERDVDLAVRVGIHTGPVVIGEMGGGASRETLAMGDTTNVAARLQTEARPGSVVLSSATLRLVSGIFVTQHLGELELKGLSGPVHVHRAERPSGVRSRLDVTAAAELTPFVGRDQELLLLEDRWAQVCEGWGQALLIAGEAGIGKSRLMQTFRERLADQAHTWLECRASPYTQDSALYPVLELQRLGLGFRPEDPAATKLEQLEAGLEAVSFDLAEAVPLMAALHGVPLGEGYKESELSPEGRRKRTLELLGEWLMRLAERQPLVLLVEDLHWMDPSTVELMGQILDRIAGAPVLLLLTYRPDFEPPWGARSHLTPVLLSRLTHAHLADLIRKAARGRDLPEAWVEEILRRADGVPLFAEELTRTVLETNPELPPGSEPPHLQIPDTLQDSLMARLDALGPVKELAQLGSVLGREFDYALLLAVSPMKQSDFEKALGAAVREELFYQRGTPPEASYLFKHALIRDAAYESMLRATRQRHHHRVAGVLIERMSGVADDQPEVVAQHLTEAGDAEAAVVWWQRAGERAIGKFANEEAIQHLTRGLAVMEAFAPGPERDQQELHLQIRLGHALNAARGYAHQDTGVAWQRAESLCTTKADPAIRGLISGYLATSRASMVPRAGLDHYRRVIEIGENSGDEILVMFGCNGCGWVHLVIGELSSSRQYFDRSESIYDPNRHSFKQAGFVEEVGLSALSWAEWTYWHLGFADRAWQLAERTLEIVDGLGNPWQSAWARGFASLTALTRGDRARARVLATDTMAIAKEHGFPLMEGVGHLVEIWEEGLFGDALVAVERWPEVMSQMASTGNNAAAPWILDRIAEVQLRADQPAEAGQMVDGALAMAQQTGQHFRDAELKRLKGECLLRLGDYTNDQVESHFREAIKIALLQGAKSLELRAATSLARLWQSHGKRTEARDLLQPVYDWFTEGFDTQDLKDAKALLEELT